MDNSMLLEAGKIVNTHGLRGEVKIQPWANSPKFLTDFDALYIDGEPRKMLKSRVHKNDIIVLFEGIADINDAIALKEKTVYIDRRDVKLEEGENFIADFIGLTAIDAETNDILGKVTDVMQLPAGNVFVINGDREILIPAVPEFVQEVSIAGGFILFRPIEGM